MEQTERKKWIDALSKRKDLEDTLAEARIVCSFPEFKLIIDAEKRSMYDEFYFFKRGLRMAYQREGYADSWIDLLLKLIDILVYRADDFRRIEEIKIKSYQEFEACLEKEKEK